MKLLKIQEVCDKVSLSRPHLYLLISQGKFPKPVKIGGGSRWLEHEIDKWIKERMKERGKMKK